VSPPPPGHSPRRPDVGRIVSGAVLVGLGGAVARAVLDDSYTAYVRPVMRVPLALTAVVLIVAGVAGCLSGIRTTPRPAGVAPAAEHHEHRHGVSRAALLALVPLAVLALVRPPALDDAATTRVAQAASQPAADSGVQVEPLAGDPDTPKQMSFNELSVRANATNGQPTLNGRMLSLEGFVSKDQKGAPAGTVRVGRYMIWCCAADATYGAAFVHWPTGTAAPAAGSWFTVVGRVQGFTTADFVAVPLITAQSAQTERPPKEQYEY
jgi:uncharacterized repeat protein (TIGR03943 family)